MEFEIGSLPQKEDGASVSLKEILKSDCFQDCQVFAGGDGLEHPVSSITISDVPDSMEWISGGELICTTGYILSINPGIQEQWLKNLAHGGAAGVLIKPERFLGEVPALMIETCDRLGLPLIGIPLDTLWSEVLNAAMDILLSKQVEQLYRIDAIHRDLEKRALTTNELVKLLDCLAEKTGYAVFFDDRYVHAEEFSEVNALPPDQRSDAAQLRRKFIPLDSTHEESLAEKNIRQIPFAEDAKEAKQIVIPVTAGNHILGWLSACPVEPGSEEFIHAVLERSADVLALKLLSRYTGADDHLEHANMLFQHFLVEGEITRREIIRYGQICGVDLELPAVFIHIHCSPKPSPDTIQFAIRLLQLTDKNGLLSVKNDRIFILFHPASDKPAPAADEIRQFCYELLKELGRIQHECHIGIGRAFSISDGASLRRSFQEAVICANVALQQNDTILFYGDLGIAKLFPFLKDIEQIQPMVETRLMPIIQNESIYLEVFEQFIASGFNKQKAAKKLGLHVNTLTRRLNKIQELIGVDADNIDEYIVLYVLLKDCLYYKKTEEQRSAQKVEKWPSAVVSEEARPEAMIQ